VERETYQRRAGETGDHYPISAGSGRKGELVYHILKLSVYQWHQLRKSVLIYHLIRSVGAWWMWRSEVSALFVEVTLQQIDGYNIEKARIAENLLSYIIASVCHIVGHERFFFKFVSQDCFVCRSIFDIHNSFSKTKIPSSGMWRRVMCVSVPSTAAPIYTPAYIWPMSHNTRIFISSVKTSNSIFCLAAARYWQPWMRVYLRCVMCTARGTKVRGLCMTKYGI
jgi:hypothetical protein